MPMGPRWRRATTAFGKRKKWARRFDLRFDYFLYFCGENGKKEIERSMAAAAGPVSHGDIEIAGVGGGGKKGPSAVPPSFLRWKNLSVQVPRKGPGGGTTNILTNVSAYVRPGSVLAIMGSSGCGKSTLLEVLSRRKEGRVSGEIEFNGKTCFAKTTVDAADAAQQPHEVFLDSLGFVQQFDQFLPNLTCAESLLYTSRLVLPRDMSDEERQKRVRQSLERVGIANIANNRIGATSDQVRISGGQRRRLSLAQELLVNPRVLFLDEPTSGLDAASALIVMQILRKLADGGMSIAITMHQPRDEIFAMIDDLLLLKSGSVVYFGAAKTCVEYFAGIGLPNERIQNPADFAIDVVCTNDAVFETLERMSLQHQMMCRQRAKEAPS